MSNKKQVRVAVIGAGNMGRYHVRNYSELKESELAAVADPSPAVADMAKEYGIKYYADFIEMLDKEKPEAVTIAVPTPFHHRVGLEVINRGIHLIIEKPIASTLAEADELIKAAGARGVVFTVGHIERFNPIVEKLKELIDSKKLGKISSIVSKRVGGFPQKMPKTDVVIDLAVHDIDLIGYLLGKKVKRIYCHGSRTLHTSKVDSAELLLDFGQASGFVQANWITPVKVRTIAVTGSKGYVEGNYVTQELAYYEHNMKVINNGFETFVSTFGEPSKQLIVVEKQEPLAMELNHFLKKIRGSEDARIMLPHEAREALRAALTATANFKEA